MTTKILLAEDEKALALSLTLKLSNAGFEVITAVDGEDAVTKLGSDKFDLLLLDLVMPKLDGFGVLEELKKRNIKIKTVILSNLAQDGDVERAKEYGVNEYWLKSDTSLLEVLERVKKLVSS